MDRSRNAPEDRAKAEMTKQNMSRTIGNYREYVHVDPRGYTLILGQPLDKLNSQLMNLRLKLLAIGIALVCFGFGIGWLLAGQALKPIRSISRTAAQIADGDLSQRIDSTETESELGQLVQVLNTTFSKLDASFEQQVRFTADASHELRTPISVILAKCQFALRRDREAEKYRQTLGECEKSAQHLRGLVESLLQLARVDSGEFSLKKENHDLGTIAMEAAHALDPLAEEKHIGFDLDCPITAANFDKERIFQVMTNLISNAIKYTQESGRIRVSTRKTEGRVSFTVEDNGNGIEKAQIPYLFDRFYRGERDRTNEHRSTGLGLAIVKSIVDAHDGSLSVESAPGKGSTFTVSLPCTS
ncbi:MAG: ATP-binding protein [Verrucomicrobiota bacterium]